MNLFQNSCGWKIFVLKTKFVQTAEDFWYLTVREKVYIATTVNKTEDYLPIGNSEICKIICQMEKKKVTFSAKWRRKRWHFLPNGEGNCSLSFLPKLREIENKTFILYYLRLLWILCSIFFSSSFNNEWTMSISFVGCKLNHISGLFDLEIVGSKLYLLKNQCS